MEAHETIWAKEGHDAWGAWGHWYRDSTGGGTSYTRTDLADAMVAAAYEAAAAKCDVKASAYQRSYKDRLSVHAGSAHVEGLSDGMDEAAQIVRALTPTDARAALDAAIAKAVAAERERCAQVAEMAGPRLEHDTPPDDQAHSHYCAKIAAAIRGQS